MTSTLWEQVEERYRCAHPHREVRRKPTRSGAEWFWDQCVSCGAALRVAAPAHAAARAAAPAFDETLQEEHHRRKAEEFDRLRDDQRQQEDAEWWAWYQTYLFSFGWQDKRRKVLDRAGGRCEGCGDAGATEVHHLTYHRVGEEMLFDLVAICHPCHEAVTEGDRKRRAAWRSP